MSVTAITNAVTEVESFGENSGGDQRRFTVTAGTDIAKGTVLKFTDNRTASKVAIGDSSGQLFGGVAAMDKEGDDPSTEISVWGNGIYEFTASGSITAGDNVKTAKGGTGNLVMTAGDTTTDTQTIVGYALANASALDRVAVRMNI